MSGKHAKRCNESNHFFLEGFRKRMLRFQTIAYHRKMESFNKSPFCKGKDSLLGTELTYA